MFYANGSIKNDKKFVVLSRYGYDLHTIHKICGLKFSYKTILNIGIEIVIIRMLIFYSWTDLRKFTNFAIFTITLALITY